MPARHRYKCLNHDCPSYTDKNKALTFIAMNSPTPSCPHCRCMRLEDLGEAVNIMGGLSANSQNSDSNFRRIADRYGLTNMDNKDGQAVKRAASPAARDEQMVKVGGFQVPASQAGMGGCVNMQGIGVPLKAEVNKSSPKNSPMMRQMTNVVAEHKGAP